MQNNMLLKWFVEMIKRFGQKSPKFFKMWQIGLTFMAALTGLPDLLESIRALHITLPDWLEAIGNNKVAFTFLGMLVMSFQTTQSTPVGVSEDGAVLKETNTKALPFTAVHEVKLANKEADKAAADDAANNSQTT